MRVLVIGSGLAGVTTAFFLRRRGLEVTVVDRATGPGTEASFANGSLLTPSMSEPWNAPGVGRHLLASIGRSEAPMQLHLRVLPSLMSWGVKFLRSSTAARFRSSARSNLLLALRSLQLMKTLREETGITYARAARGSLRIFRDPAALDAAVSATALSGLEELVFQRLSREETLAREPGLEPIRDQLAGGLYCATDEVGDAYRFCVELTALAQNLGVRFHFQTEAASLESRSGVATGVLTDKERLVADFYVVAAGSYSTPLLRSIGLRLPVQPAKGYSITFDEAPERPSLRVPVVDDQLHAGVVPIDGAIRAVGTAEFAGFDKTLSPERIRNLTQLLRQILPRSTFDFSQARPWCGLRPMSADGVPIIGSTPITNVLINTGHGHLGWTLAAGSAELLSDLICNEAPSLDPTPFSYSRFS